MAPNGITNKVAITRHHYNIANLETINFKRLKQGDATEIQRLIQNCKNPGFFHLDLKDDQGYLDALEALYKAEETYFDQSAEIKMNDFRQSQDRGYERTRLLEKTRPLTFRLDSSQAMTQKHWR
jgi:isopenicillin N synthase-like dioxygenase